MATTKYLFQRGSAPILQWGRMAPRGRRAADLVSLGAYENTTIIPGGPEPIQGLGGILTDVTNNMGSFVVGLVVGALGYHVIKGV